MTKEYNVGDKVLLKNFRRKHGLGTVEQIRYKGPYVIHQYCSKGNYKLRDNVTDKVAGPYNQTSLKRYFYESDKLDNSDMMSEVDDDKTENDDGNIEIDQSVEESNDSNSINSAKDINDNNSKESEIEIQSGQTNYQLETSNYEFADPVDLFDLQVSPQYICEEDNEMESENEILCTPQSKRLRKSNKRKSYEYY
jgi:hypothetical protein